MKIGIVTYWNSSDNYGQILQCYALQKHLKNQGHNAFLIRYTPISKRSFIEKLIDICSIKKIQFLFSKERKKLKYFYQEERKREEINAKLNTQRNFNAFRKENLNYSERIYTSIEELRKLYPEADCYIAGSDQVWNNPIHNKNTAGWFLDFGSKNTLRLSYAASIGREINSNEINKFKSYIRKIDAVSVREISSRILFNSIGLPTPTVTIDPTLLLNKAEYLALFKKVQPTIKKEFLFLYVLNITTKEEMHWESIDSYTSRERLEIKIVCSSGYYQARELVSGYNNIQATIPEWLSLIYHSKEVITTSFHGMVFAIKFNKPFIIIPLTNKYSKGNIRIYSLLEKLGLSNRIYNPDKTIDSQMKEAIDWEKVNNSIEKLKEESILFLNEYIK